MTLYLSMLKEAINGNNSINVFRSNINFYDSAYIPSDYLPSTVERLKIYKVIDEVKTFDNLVKARLNLEDRCGKLPQEVQNLFKNEEIKIKCKVLKFSKIMSTSKQTKITIDLPIESKIQTKLINLITKNTSLFILKNNELIYKLNENDPSIRRSKINNILDDLL
ncbi:MAG: transcription-repair-coupling factor [SAR86 cluster bacterium SAR86B]|uniref:Transcription-repair-coupling factor n=1 Tax=SAR86 cluster bacterium SAR86B TaxID=1123867 RepID=J4KSF5_9GAMM|nr:MAG: transcription-repair-coupling factor [SAR86 cluster bacterium SAR86B]